MDKKSSKVVTELSDFTYANLLGVPKAINSWQTSGNERGATYSVKDPVQGCVGDCYFMAALASVAWAASTRIKRYPNYEFRNPATGVNTAVTLETKDLPKDAQNSLIFARLGPSEYTWAALYEKAYAKFRNCGSVDGTPDHLNISGLNGGCSINGLISITRWPTNVVKSVADWDTNKPPNNSGKANVPAIAWTAARTDLPSGIYPNHSYSLLGFLPAANPAWVVLRNPYGSLIAEPNTNVKVSDVWNGIDFANVGDGIFALTVQAFKSYFYQYGWVRS